MQFLYPKVLWALTALLIPIIIHLFNFRKYTTVYFSNVAFLQNIRKESKSKSVLKNLLILLLRLLAITFLVLVFAKPYIPNNENEQIVDKAHVAFYIDNSFSMDAEGKHGILLETAKLKARELANLLPSNTHYLLISNEFSVKHQRFVGRELFVDWVSQIESTHVVRDLNEVMAKISVLLPKTDSLVKHQVYLLSDFQENILKNYNANNAEAVKIAAVPIVGKNVGNLFIDSVWFKTPGHYKGKEELLQVNIVNRSEEDFNEIPLTFYVNDSIQSSIVFDIEAQKSKEIDIPFSIWNTGEIRAYIEISDYPITFDNKLYFNYKVSEKKNVLLINGNDTQGYFEALYQGDDNIVASSTNETEIPFSSFVDYELIVLNQITNLSTGLVNAAMQFCKQGGNLLLIPSQKANLTSYHLLTEELGVKLEPFIEQEGTISYIDVNNGLLINSLGDELEESKYPEYNGFFPIKLYQRSNAQKLFSSESNIPLFVGMPFHNGRFYLSGLPINQDLTDLVTHPLFVPLFYNIALFASKPSELFYWINPETRAQVRFKSGSSEVPTLTGLHDGKELKPKFNISGNFVRFFPEIDQLKSGHYKYAFGSEDGGIVSYNFDRDESEISYNSEQEILDILNETGSVANIINFESKHLERSVKLSTQGKTLVNLFLWLFLAVLVSEMLALRFFK